MFQNYIGEQNINFFKALLLLHVCFFPLYNLGFRFSKNMCTERNYTPGLRFK